jgi:hypothetical protein
MKVGDLVRLAHPYASNAAGRSLIATVIEVGVYCGFKNTKVFWAHNGHTSTEQSKHLVKIEKS